MEDEKPACIGVTGIRKDCTGTIAKVDAKGIDVLNEQSELKRTQDMGRMVVQVEACTWRH